MFSQRHARSYLYASGGVVLYKGLVVTYVCVCVYMCVRVYVCVRFRSELVGEESI